MRLSGTVSPNRHVTSAILSSTRRTISPMYIPPIIFSNSYHISSLTVKKEYTSCKLHTVGTWHLKIGHSTIYQMVKAHLLTRIQTILVQPYIGKCLRKIIGVEIAPFNVDNLLPLERAFLTSGTFIKLIMCWNLVKAYYFSIRKFIKRPPEHAAGFDCHGFLDFEGHYFHDAENWTHVPENQRKKHGHDRGDVIVWGAIPTRNCVSTLNIAGVCSCAQNDAHHCIFIPVPTMG